ncbi:hypothetical protein HAP94_06230 [Acidithiobacillus ferrivorans]|nr:hypothetical protein [Acidithiobacillus ferrivorans]
MECKNSRKTKIPTYIAYISGSALLLSIFMAVTAHDEFEKVPTTILLVIGMIGLPVSMIMHDCQK